MQEKGPPMMQKTLCYGEGGSWGPQVRITMTVEFRNDHICRLKDDKEQRRTKTDASPRKEAAGDDDTVMKRRIDLEIVS